MNHQILIKKRDEYGIRGAANTWINSYLANHKQFVSFNDNISTTKTALCGVQQG